MRFKHKNNSKDPEFTIKQVVGHSREDSHSPTFYSPVLAYLRSSLVWKAHDSSRDLYHLSSEISAIFPFFSVAIALEEYGVQPLIQVTDEGPDSHPIALCSSPAQSDAKPSSS